MTQSAAIRAADLFDLSGEVALVTGASSGLGKRFARVLAANGAKVALVARRKDRLEGVAQEIVAAGGQAIALEPRPRRQRAETPLRAAGPPAS